MKRQVWAAAIVLVLLGLAFPAGRAFAWANCDNPYTVVRGDYLALIAQKCDTTVHALLSANPAITNPNLIYPGQKLALSGSGTTITATPAPTITPAPTGVPVTGGRSYTVRYGDTLWSIARRFGVALIDLQNANPQIKNHRLIFVGQVIKIP